MSLVDTPRPNIVAGGRSRWSWGPEPKRLVHVFGQSTDAGLVVRVVGHENGEFVLLDSQPAIHIDRRAVHLADGTVWQLAGGGCGCGSPMKRFDPSRTSLRDARPTEEAPSVPA